MGPMAPWDPSERDAGRSESEGKVREAGVGGMPVRGGATATGRGGAGGRGEEEPPPPEAGTGTGCCSPGASRKSALPTP